MFERPLSPLQSFDSGQYTEKPWDKPGLRLSAAAPETLAAAGCSQSSDLLQSRSADSASQSEEEQQRESEHLSDSRSSSAPPDQPALRQANMISTSAQPSSHADSEALQLQDDGVKIAGPQPITFPTDANIPVSVGDSHARSDSLPSEEIEGISRMTLGNGPLPLEASTPPHAPDSKPGLPTRRSKPSFDGSNGHRAGGNAHKPPGGRVTHDAPHARRPYQHDMPPQQQHMPPFMQPHAPPHMMQYAPGAMPMSHQSMPMANGWPMAHANGMHMLPHPGPFYMLPANLGPDGQAMPMFYPDPRLGPPPTAFPLEGPPGSPVMLHPPYGGFPPGVSSPEHHMMMMQQQKHWHDMQQVQHMQLQIHAAIQGVAPPGVPPGNPPGTSPRLITEIPMPPTAPHPDTRQAANGIPRSGSRKSLSPSNSGLGLAHMRRSSFGSHRSEHDRHSSQGSLVRGSSFSSLHEPDRRSMGHRRQTSMPAALDDRGSSGSFKGLHSERSGGHRRVKSTEEAQELLGPSPDVLERYKSERAGTADPSLEELRGCMYEFCRDQHGSRFIQQKIAEASPKEMDQMFQEVQDRCLKLMRDVFGNYVIQKFLEHGGAQQRLALAERLRTQVLPLSMQMYGCRVIQKALEVLDESWQMRLVDELRGRVLDCVADQNGNHVIQKCIECIKPTSRIAFVIQEIMATQPRASHRMPIEAGAVPLSRHSYGCRVIQRVLEHCDMRDVRAELMACLLGATRTLAQDTYGNYVIQHILEHGSEADREAVLEKLYGSFQCMSQHKFASNVVEVCLARGNTKQRDRVVGEILNEGGNSQEQLQIMMKDQFGNYVIQKVLEVCNEDRRRQLIADIQAQAPGLKKMTYGKHIVPRIEKLLESAQAMDTQATASATAAQEGAAASAASTTDAAEAEPSRLPAEEQ